MNTNANSLEPLARAALLAVYELGAAGRPAHLGSVTAELGCTRASAAQALATLDRAGLLWAERCRLSMSGLALAVRLWSQRARARRFAA